MEFKVGDKVRVLSTDYFINRKNTKIQDIITIKSFNPDGLYKNYIHFTNGDRIGYDSDETGLELVKETYTLKECQEQGISIFCETREQAERIHQVLEGKLLSGICGLFPIEVRVGFWEDKLYFSYNNSSDKRDGYIGKDYNINKVIDFEQVKFEDVKKIIGYKLINKYPQRSIGDLCNYIPKINNTNFIWNDDKTVIPRDFQPDVTPDWFTPVYEEKKPVTIFKDKIEIIISDKIVAAGVTVDINELKDLLLYTPDEGYLYNKLGKTWNINPILDLKGFKLGCTEFTIDELKNIVKVYEEWNR